MGHESGITWIGGTTEDLPLFQINFLSDLMQVKVLLPTTDVIPTLVHFAPAFTAALAGNSGMNNERESVDKTVISLLFID